MRIPTNRTMATASGQFLVSPNSGSNYTPRTTTESRVLLDTRTYSFGRGAYNFTGDSAYSSGAPWVDAGGGVASSRLGNGIDEPFFWAWRKANISALASIAGGGLRLTAAGTNIGDSWPGTTDAGGQIIIPLGAISSCGDITIEYELNTNLDSGANPGGGLIRVVRSGLLRWTAAATMPFTIARHSVQRYGDLFGGALGESCQVMAQGWGTPAVDYSGDISSPAYPNRSVKIMVRGTEINMWTKEAGGTYTHRIRYMDPFNLGMRGDFAFIMAVGCNYASGISFYGELHSLTIGVE